jgi:hypothetical protein
MQVVAVAGDGLIHFLLALVEAVVVALVQILSNQQIFRVLLEQQIQAVAVVEVGLMLLQHFQVVVPVVQA